ncbi:MAG TPA: glycosyltransferase family 2 protein [Verrucomicrobiae bacterium]|nr:glycosyltransferase family 2 protein [Verrucomicrobiae bacterium]
MPEPVSLYVIAYNEAPNLREVLPTVLWADEVVVVDSFSTDDTAAVCTQFGVRHVNIPFEGFGKLRNAALALLKHDWVVSIDSDERGTPEFAEEVRCTLTAPRHAAYFVPRRNTFLGRPVRFGGMYPDYRQPQVFDRRKFRYREDPVHEGFHCDGSIGYFKHFIWQHPWPSLKVIMQKGDRYTTLAAQQRFGRGQRAGALQLWGHPLAAFLKKYFLQQGFRDGVPGLMIATLHAFYTFVKYAKMWELQHGRSQP